MANPETGGPEPESVNHREKDPASRFTLNGLIDDCLATRNMGQIFHFLAVKPNSKQLLITALEARIENEVDPNIREDLEGLEDRLLIS